MKKITFLFSLLLTVSMYAQHNVTFMVDMAGQTFTTVYVSGSFNGWSGTSNPMVQVGASTVYAVTLPLANGTHEYKFTIDDWAGQENFTEGDVCTVTTGGFSNRLLVVDNADQTLATSNYDMCAESSSNPGPHSVTLRVNMNSYGGSFTTVNVNGQNRAGQGFGNWCGGCIPMNDLGGGIWEVTLVLEEYNYQFKFTVDAWTDQENFTSGDPETHTDGGFTNRYIQVAGDMTKTFIWDTPQSFALGTDNFDLSEVKLYPNPTENQWQVSSKDAIKKLEVFNLLGKRVLSITPNTKVATIVADKLNSGIYLAKIETASGTGAMKLIKK